jgi:hypothetical protein
VQAVNAERQLFYVDTRGLDPVEQRESIEFVYLNCSESSTSRKQTSVRTASERVAIRAMTFQNLIVKWIEKNKLTIKI